MARPTCVLDQPALQSWYSFTCTSLPRTTNPTTIPQAHAIPSSPTRFALPLPCSKLLHSLFSSAHPQTHFQAAVLNASYASTNIAFNVVESTYTIRDDWATDASSTQMKQQLRRGGYAVLNIYFQTNLSTAPYTYNAGSTLLGYCTLPTTITYGNPPTPFPENDYATDGCSVLAGSMKGSPTPVYGYNQGKTAVHEVGHWFGMLHTFQVQIHYYFHPPNLQQVGREAKFMNK